MVDSALREGVDAEEWQERVLNDGTRHRVYKRYFTGAGLADELGTGDVLHDGRWFVVAVRLAAGTLCNMGSDPRRRENWCLAPFFQARAVRTSEMLSKRAVRS